MKEFFKVYLFQKHILVAEQTRPDVHAFETLFALASKFNIRIVSGGSLAQPEMIRFAAAQLGIDIPKPFYEGFPRSVRALSPDQLLFDQMVHYTVTYGFGHFSEAGHSLLEEALERTAFQEKSEIRDFSILSESAAEEKLAGYAENLLSSTRPLSEEQYAFLRTYIDVYRFQVRSCGSKNTAIRLLLDFRGMHYAAFLSLSDVIKVVDELNFRVYGNTDVKKLNLKNQDRKFLTALINTLFDEGRCDLRNCFEKKAVWCGLLHHLHYKPRNEASAQFVAAMRGSENGSVYSQFEQAMGRRDVRAAFAVLKEGKGSAAVLRNLDYLISRCSGEEDVRFLLDNIGTSNSVVLMQLMLRYSIPASGREARSFTFTKYNKLKTHSETPEEVSRRKTFLTPAQVRAASDRVSEALRKNLKHRLGTVYLDPAMKNMAPPIQEAGSQGGFGVLARGSRLHMGEGKKVRAFTYWEKVDDIDLSVIGLTEDGEQTEFSWRTMSDRQSSAITYSGDETSGYRGGSEYFDIDLPAFRKQYPHIRYLVFCDNVYSNLTFDQCFCKGGYMTRDMDDSGEIFEPKTVESSFLVNCSSRFAYLFGIDLNTNDFVWLNTARSSSAAVAGATSMDFLIRYFHTTSTLSLYSLFEMMAAEVVSAPEEAQVVLSDRTLVLAPGAEQIRSYDFERILALMNQ